MNECTWIREKDGRREKMSSSLMYKIHDSCGCIFHGIFHLFFFFRSLSFRYILLFFCSFSGDFFFFCILNSKPKKNVYQSKSQIMFNVSNFPCVYSPFDNDVWWERYSFIAQDRSVRFFKWHRAKSVMGSREKERKKNK